MNFQPGIKDSQNLHREVVVTLTHGQLYQKKKYCNANVFVPAKYLPLVMSKERKVISACTLEI
jgi:hypothetical protein